MSLQQHELLGVQVPQILHLPAGVHSHDAAREAIELADSVGMLLDESQQFTLKHALAERDDFTWSAFEVCDVQPRQNGKGETIQARELAGLFIFGEQLIIHTAHELPTAMEAFRRMCSLIDSSKELSSKVAQIRLGNGDQTIELKSGARLKYKARTGGSGRGFAGASLIVFDEAYNLQAEHLAALMPTLSTHPNPQVWYASSAGLSTSSALWKIRRRALGGDAGRLAYMEHTAEQVALDEKGNCISQRLDVNDRNLVALANPAYGTRIRPDFVEAEHDAMGDDMFARERLGVWDSEPDALRYKDVKIPDFKWAQTLTSTPPELGEGEITISFDVTFGNQFASIAIAAGSIAAPYVEVIEHREGLGWLPARLVSLVERWKPTAVGCNGAGPAGAAVGPVLAAFRDAGISADLLHQVNMPDYKQACGGFFSDVIEGRLSRPANQGPLDVAAADAAERQLGDAWVWDLRSSVVPISPLVAVTIARCLLPVGAVAVPQVFAY